MEGDLSSISRRYSMQLIKPKCICTRPFLCSRLYFGIYNEPLTMKNILLLAFSMSALQTLLYGSNGPLLPGVIATALVSMRRKINCVSVQIGDRSLRTFFRNVSAMCGQGDRFGECPKAGSKVYGCSDSDPGYDEDTETCKLSQDSVCQDELKPNANFPSPVIGEFTCVAGSL